MQCQDKIWLEEQYITKKRSMKDIAEECNVCSSTILKWLRKLNIPTRTKKESILIYHSKKERGKETYKNRKWLYNQYINLKKSSLQIAKECECSKPVILYYLKKFNIDRRQGSEALKGKTGRDKGFNQKEETKKKISEKAIERYKDPNNHPMIGKHQTEESKEKSRKRLKGKKYEEIYGEEKAIKIKKKMSISQQGRIQSEETRKKISEAQKGRTYEDIYGEEKAQEIKGKISKALKGRTYEDIYGEERAIEIKEKISEKAKGDKNPNWKGGIDKRESLYNTKEWRNIRKIIYHRDNNICQLCNNPVNIFDNSLFPIIHHIIPVSYKDFRYITSNLILVHLKCHNWIHSNQNINKKFILEPTLENINYILKKNKEKTILEYIYCYN